MADLNPTTRILQAFDEVKEVPSFLASMFTFDGTVQTQRDIEWDVRRGGRDVAVPVPTLASGGRANQVNVFTNKHGEAPVYMEPLAATVYEGDRRAMGSSIYDPVNVVANVMKTVSDGVGLIAAKIRRSMELQASQILSTGTITLADSTGATVFSQNYGMRGAHIVTTGTSWATSATCTPITDIETVSRVVKSNCGRRVVRLVMGSNAFRYFRESTQVQNHVNKNMWNIYAPAVGVPDYRLETGNYHGILTVDGTSVEIWTYDGIYQNPNGGAETAYVGTDKVLFIADAERRIIVGGIPRLRPMDAIFNGRIPQTIKATGPGGYAIDLHAYVPEDGLSAVVQMGCRPVLVPVALDSFAILDVVP